jgi:glycosyltransferase involved in cell wall biosynthesis
VLADAGLLVEPENPTALADALSTLIRDEALRDEYSRRAAARAPIFTLEKMVEGYAGIIEDLAARYAYEAGRHRTFHFVARSA